MESGDKENGSREDKQPGNLHMTAPTLDVSAMPPLNLRQLSIIHGYCVFHSHWGSIMVIVIHTLRVVTRDWYIFGPWASLASSNIELFLDAQQPWKIHKEINMNLESDLRYTVSFDFKDSK